MRTARTIAAFVCLASVSSAQAELLKLSAPNGKEDDELGRSVAFGSGLVLAGAPYDQAMWSRSGSVRVFDARTGDELFRLRASDGADVDGFGRNVSTSGNRAIAGAPGKDDFGVSSGSAYLFDLTTGQELAKLSASDAGRSHAFGISVAISGNRAIVGAPGVQPGGAAYVFDVSTGQELVKLTASDGAPGDEFGASVAISGDKAVVGAIGDDGVGDTTGSAYVFDVASGQELFKLTGSAVGVHDEMGRAVAIGGDRILVGAPGDHDPGHDSGAVYVFDATTGLEIAKLEPSDNLVYDLFGWSVAIHGDWAVVGARGHYLGSGKVYLYHLPTGKERARLLASDGASLDQFGAAVAIQGDRIVAGAPGDAEYTGGVYVFGFAPPIGQPYCGPAAANSTGSPAYIRAAGSAAAGDDDVYLTAHDMPPKRLGYFLCGPTQGFVPNPGGSQGDLCLTGVVGRYRKDVARSDANGFASLVLDLTALPLPGGSHAVVAGETWNFTRWYRDENPLPTSNFTDGVSVTFQ